MRSVIRLTALVVFGLCVLPLVVADDAKPPVADKKADAKDLPKKDADAKDPPKKDADAKDPPKKDADAKDPPKKDEKKDSPWVRAGQISGELVSVDETKKIVKIKVTTAVPRVDQNEANALAQAKVNYANALSKRPPDLNGAAQAERDIATHQANLIKYDKKSQDHEVPTLDDVKVRIPAPPVVFDDDGKIKRPTAEELRKLKGDPPQPGYPGDFSNLRSGQMVTVTLMRNKDAKPPAAGKPDPFTGKPPDIDLTGDYVPHASMIVIVADTGK
jgi:hypothetical protein